LDSGIKRVFTLQTIQKPFGGIMKYPVNSLFLLIAFSLGVVSCASLSYTPHSELVMFQEERIPSTGEIRSNRYMHGIASVTHTGIRDKQLDSRFADYENILQTSYTTHSIFMNEGNNAFSFGLGTTAGVDVTLPVFRKRFDGLYLTQAFSPGAIQTIMQKRVLQKQMFGLGTGLHYQYSRGGVSVDRSCGYLTIYCESYKTHTLGLRSVITYSFQPRSDVENLQTLYATAALRYDFKLQTVYPAVSISLVIR
jgi:hypothetical protein